MRNKTVKKGLLFICVLGVLAVGAYGGNRWYKSFRQKHLVNQARAFLATTNSKNALLCLERALTYNSKDPNACRLMAELAEAARSPSALIWRSRVVEFNPTSSDDRLALAETAIKQHDYKVAADALGGVSAAKKNTAPFHNVAGALAIAQNQTEAAEEHFRAAARLEPTNAIPLLNLAVIHLQGSNATALAEARSFLRSLASSPTNAELRAKALRELVGDAMRHRETNAALALSKELLQQTNSVFQDQLLRLDILSHTGNAELNTVLASVQRQAEGDLQKIAELASWEATRSPPKEVLAWLRSLPQSTQTNQTIAMLVADCYAGIPDWSGLQSFLKPQDWKGLDFLRHAMLARAWRGQEMLESAKIEWDAAEKAAQGSKQDLVMLLRLAARWKWPAEQEELLWTIVNHYPGDQEAVQVLAKTLFLEGRTRSILQLYNQVSQRDPSSLAARNNVAFAALLLNAQEYKPHDLARKVYLEAPTNSSCVSTYALSLLLQKKQAEALKTIEALSPRQLEDPSIASCYGLALQANGHREKSAKYLRIASNSPLLPEERKLVQKASVNP